MKIISGPGKYRLQRSYDERDTVSKGVLRVMFTCEYKGGKSSFLVAITSLEPQDNRETVFNFSAEDSIGQILKGWYDTESRKGEINVAD